MNKEQFLETLGEFVNDNKELPLYLLGTGNLMLQGIDVIPNDVDFITSKSIIKQLAKKYKTPVSENESGYYEIEIMIKGTEVHVVSNDGNPLRPINLDSESTKITINGLSLEGLTLESEREAYRQMGRKKDENKVALIDKQIKLNRAKIK